jgi:hypothetical protein
MKGSLRAAAGVLLLVASLSIAVAPAAASSAPANDTLAGATIVAATPFSQQIDTTAATTDAIDAEANVTCGAPATAASVWYDYTPATDDAIVVDVSQSSFGAGIIVVSGNPGSLTLEACGPGGVAFAAYAGVTYHVMAFSDTAGINGGMLSISIDTAPPPPTLSVTIDPVGHVNQKTGVVTVSGKYTCSGVAYFGEIDGVVTQQVGRFNLTGSFFVDASVCDGTTQTWTGAFVGDNGRFSGGKAASFAYSFACGPIFCSNGYTEQKLQLKR